MNQGVSSLVSANGQKMQPLAVEVMNGHWKDRKKGE